MKKKYTKKIHAERMKKCLAKFESGDDFCPAAWRYRTDHFSGYMWDDSCGDYRYQCRICREFVGLSTTDCHQRCPCHELGCEEAIRRAIIAIAKEGKKRKGGTRDLTDPYKQF